MVAAITGTTAASGHGRHQHGPPVRVPDLIAIVAHETYPGHHLEHAWKEADLVGGTAGWRRRFLLINTPECLVSGGWPTLGRSFADP
jgi:hypothetical protein